MDRAFPRAVLSSPSHSLGSVEGRGRDSFPSHLKHPPQSSSSGATHAQKANLCRTHKSLGALSPEVWLWGFFLCLEDSPVPIRSVFPFRKLSGFPEDREQGERGRQKSPVKKPPCFMQSLNHSFPPWAARPSGLASTRPDAEAGTRPLRSLRGGHSTSLL